MPINLKRRVVGKAANYTVNPYVDRCGTVFTNKGATGGITFTLPAPNAGLLGLWYRFKTVVDQDVTIATATADTMLSLNDLAADSLAISTSSQKIGGEIEAQVVESVTGTFKWAVCGVAVGHTYTLAS